jgi:hypothetical protein
MKRLVLIILVAALPLTNIGCGSDDDGGASPCEEAMSKLCQMACDCVEGDGCAMGDENASFSLESLDDCRELYISLGCAGGGSDKIDYPACTQALEAEGQCVDSAGGKALTMPEECNESEEGN